MIALESNPPVQDSTIEILSLFFYPELRGPKLIWIFLAFILFRFFDIYKIFPINIVDKKMKNGLGIILDDILAGIYATITIVILLKLLT